MVWASFTNRGAAWVSRANEAAQHWTDLTVFDFIPNSGSANRLRTGNLDCNTLANMSPVEDALGIYRTSFVITVNVNPGCPSIVWYTGTGTPPMGTYDLRTVLRHEFGHAAGLDHVNGAGTQLMHPTVNQQAVKQIAADDQNGMQFLYNPNSGIRLTAAASYWPGGTYDNNYTQVGYKGPNWTGGSPFPRALFQTASWSNQTSASSWFAFFGDRITWVFTKAHNRGWQDIYIDGNFVQSINTDDDNDILWQVHKTWDMSTPGYHILEVRGLVGGTAYTDLDAYVVNIIRQQGTHDNASSAIRYLGSWTHGTGWQGPTNGTISWSNTADDAIVFTFIGDGITYWYSKVWNRGIAKVTIDGNFVQTIDLYNPNVVWLQSIRWPLAFGTHTIHIAMTGDKHPNSQGTYIDVDQFVVD